VQPSAGASSSALSFLAVKVLGDEMPRVIVHVIRRERMPGDVTLLPNCKPAPTRASIG
jgi:hypothetical protein